MTEKGIIVNVESLSIVAWAEKTDELHNRAIVEFGSFNSSLAFNRYGRGIFITDFDDRAADLLEMPEFECVAFPVEDQIVSDV